MTSIGKKAFSEVNKTLKQMEHKILASLSYYLNYAYQLVLKTSYLLKCVFYPTNLLAYIIHNSTKIKKAVRLENSKRKKVTNCLLGGTFGGC